MKKLKKLSVIHPFLFAISPVLFLFAYNIYEVPAGDLLLPIVVVVTGTLILFFSLRLITKSYVKTGIITSFFLILFFSYGHIRDLIYSLQRFDAYNPGDQTLVSLLLASLWVVLFIAGAFLVIKSRSNFQGFTKFLNATAVTLVIISLINISIYEIKTIDLGQGKINEESSLSSSENLPDIYYIILDEYARADILKEIYNYDNSEFIDYLTDKGFYVASRSRCNYPQSTVPSLSSSLSMEYVIASVSWAERIEMIQNSKVSQFLKSRGYRYIYISTGYYEKGMSKYAEVYGSEPVAFGIRMGNLASYLIRSTALAPFGAYFVGSNIRTQLLYAFDKLADMPNIEGPTFVFAHVNCPHPPFVFDHNGKPTTSVSKGLLVWLRSYQEGYVDQLIFVNKKVKALVDEILSKSDVAPIIILQSDSGPASSGQVVVPEAELTKVQLDERVNILNAYFLPENGNRLLYESISPVNTFRIVFNLYFDTNYDLLEDKSYFSQYKSPYKFITVPPEGNSD